MAGRKAEVGAASPEVHADVGPHSHSADVGEVHITPLFQESPSSNHNDFSCEISPKSDRRAAVCGFHILSQGSSTCFCFWGSVERCSSPAVAGQGTGSGCGVFPMKQKGFQQQRGSGVRSDPKDRKNTTYSPGKSAAGWDIG